MNIIFLFETFRYSTIHGGVRIGRLLEDMDIFAVHLGEIITYLKKLVT